MQSTIPKLMNKLVADQHGFYPGQSTATNLSEYSHYLTQALEDGYQVDSIYTDFSKAFDRVDQYTNAKARLYGHKRPHAELDKKLSLK